MAANTGRWTETDIPDLHGRTALVTGANSGLGLRTALMLAEHGARVLLACRSAERGAAAVRTVTDSPVVTASGGGAELIRLDLADLGSVAEAAAAATDSCGGSLDLLINNAGLMGTPKGVTVDGFETQFGTNHLGHAALTWRLMPVLRAAEAARVVTVSSVAASGAKIDFADPNFTARRYNPATAYGQAKMANQVFAMELDRRLRGAGESTISVAAHPGYSSTGLGSAMARSRTNRVVRAAISGAMWVGETVFSQNAERGSLPQLYAATAEEVRGGDYIGPDGLGGTRGHPTTVAPLGPARSPEVGRALWELTAELTGVTPDPA